MRGVGWYRKALLSAALTAAAAACAGDGGSSATGPDFKKDKDGSDGQPYNFPAYTFQVGPSGGSFSLPNGNRITFPANAICDRNASGYAYGPSEWYKACATDKKSVNIVAKVRLDGDGRTTIDFEPALRFSPSVTVSLSIYDPGAKKKAYDKMLYCDSNGSCVDEEKTYKDKSLSTSYDKNNDMFSRRILHFSGYNVAARYADDAY